MPLGTLCNCTGNLNNIVQNNSNSNSNNNNNNNYNYNTNYLAYLFMPITWKGVSVNYNRGQVLGSLTKCTERIGLSTSS